MASTILLALPINNDLGPILKRVIIALCCFSLSAFAKDQLPDIADHPDIRGALAITDAWIDGMRAYRDVPGVSVGFVVDQQLIFARGYGYANVRGKVPANADSIYSICSISKLFTSIAVMQMRDAGKLRLRDAVADHLDWFNIQQRHATAGPARVQGLLTHSSGLPRESDFPYWSDKAHPFPTREQMINQLRNQQTLYPTDSVFQYSNLGMSLAGEIVSHHAGVAYETYVQERILAPLEMTDTRPFFPERQHGRQMAVGYSGMTRERQRKRLKPFHTQAITPAAGFTSTVNDLAKFAAWNFRTLNGEDAAVLDPNTLREMQRVHWVDPDWKTAWGLGFSVQNRKGTTVVGHKGTCPGYSTDLLLEPERKIAAIVLTNASDGPARVLTNGMRKTIGAALQNLSSPRQKNEPPPDLTRYEGRYGGDIWGGETVIRTWGNQLALIRLPSNEMKVWKARHLEGDTFVRRTDDGEEREHWHFQADASGRITGLKIHGTLSPRLD